MNDEARADAPLQISAVIPNWNGMEHLDGCLASLQRQRFTSVEVILVDNASTDGSVKHVRDRFPAVRILENPRNYGFAKACAVGLTAARGEFVFFLNNDTVLDEECLGALVRAAESHPEAAVFSPKLLFFHNPFLINSAGLEMNFAGYCWDRAFARIDAPRWNLEAEILGCTGGAMFARAAVVKEAGGFDPGFRFYFEDIDLCLRVRAAGHRILYVPRAVVHHKYSASMSLRGHYYKEYLVQRNRLRLIFRNFNLLAFSVRHPAFWVYTLGAILKALFRYRAYRQAALKTRALIANLVLLPAFAVHRIGKGKRLDERTRALIGPRAERPILPQVHRTDYTVSHPGAEGLPSRLMVGVNDFALGHGWYPRERARLHSEKCRGGAMYRWFGKTAAVFLHSPCRGNAVLQLHAHFPRSYMEFRGGTWPVLTIRVDGRDAGSCRMTGEWCTFAVPVRVEGSTAKVDFEVDRMVSPEDGLPEPRDLGVALNEISLLPEGSVFLREPV